MAAFSSVIAAAGIAAGAVGTGLQVVGQRKAQKGAERAERLREAQMNLETNRSNRQILRQTLAARATAISNASAQGAMEGSGLQGGLSQIQSQGTSATLASNQNREIGAGMFGANRQISQGNSLSATGSGLSSLGNGLVNNSETIGRIGNYFTGRPAFA